MSNEVLKIDEAGVASIEDSTNDQEQEETINNQYLMQSTGINSFEVLTNLVGREQLRAWPK